MLDEFANRCVLWPFNSEPYNGSLIHASLLEPSAYALHY
jgi:hypothetical protein